MRELVLHPQTFGAYRRPSAVKGFPSVNRSHRRSAVMSWSLAAWMVCSVVGFLTTAPTSADTDSGGNGATVTHRQAGRGPDGPARPAGAAERSDGQRGGRGTAPGTRPSHDWPWPCPDWPYWPPLLPPVDTEVDNRNALFIDGEGAATVTPPMSGVTAMTVTSVPGLSDLAKPETANGPDAEPPGAANAPAPATLLSSPMNRPNGGPMLPSPSPPAPRPASGPPRPAGLPSASSAPQPAAPAASGLAKVAAQALPGLVGLAALTGVGGLLGYRQAKAGFALHAAGTAGYLP